MANPHTSGNEIIKNETAMEEKVLKVIGNFHAYSLVKRVNFSVFQSSSGHPFNSELRTITLEKMASYHDFDDDMIKNIVFARKLRIENPSLFKELEGSVSHKMKTNFVNEGSVEFKNDSYSSLEANFHLVKNYLVPGNEFSNKLFLILFHSGEQRDVRDYSILDFLSLHHYGGSKVVKLKIGSTAARFILFILKKYKKIDAIINVYSGGRFENSWNSFQEILLSSLSNDPKKEMIDFLGSTPKNKISNNWGFDIRELSDMLEHLHWKK